MKTLGCSFAIVLLLTGCATTSTIETRKQERLGTYVSLNAEQKAAVDKGQIKVGMTMDAVYIAWGRPSQILAGETAQGSLVTWLYHGTYMEEHRYWAFQDYYHRGRYYSSPSLYYDYYPRGYVSAEVKFEGGLVKEWRSLPQPGY
jgi:uncharacterized protein YceK